MLLFSATSNTTCNETFTVFGQFHSLLHLKKELYNLTCCKTSLENIAFWAGGKWENEMSKIIFLFYPTCSLPCYQKFGFLKGGFCCMGHWDSETHSLSGLKGL